ncbi:unnamed protein product [Rotaria sp. Silwood2]|nr:unnamed protein product [Rotaria sp. Silwood2]
MNQSEEDKICRFQELVPWKNREYIIHFLKLYEWNFEFAVEGFFLNAVVYADYIASGRALLFLEHYMIDNVLPHYVNTQSKNNACESQTTKLREGSRALIKKYVNANDDDVVIFVGSGSTDAISKLVNVLNLKDERIQDQTVVFTSTFEHDSNIVPWVETGVEFVRIPNNEQGLLDENFLKAKLEYYHIDRQKHIMCTFNAASNITGVLTDADRISTLVHQYNGWIFWDYSTAAPYLKIDMNSSKIAYKDAVFISTHKFIGGLGAPDILIAKKKLFTNESPVNYAGGTINFVTRTRIEYVNDIEIREEGGSPDILGSIRAGLVFHLKESVDCHFIEERENELVEKFRKHFKNHPTLKVLGSLNIRRLAIFSFLIYVPMFKKFLHHNFICVLLNDLFGIQVNSECSCAGPYVLDLLNIDDATAEIYTQFAAGDENNPSASISRIPLMRPGFTRFNLSYFANDDEIDYILNAIDFIANYGWMFLSLYTYNPDTSIWSLRDISSKNYLSQLHSLRTITYEDGTMQENTQKSEKKTFDSNISQSLITTNSNDPIEQAKSIVENIPEYISNHVDHIPNDPILNVPNIYINLIWFVTPIQIIRKIADDFKQKQETERSQLPFYPRFNE